MEKLDLILCKFIKIYDDDINLSTYTINNILDSIRNLLMTNNDITVLIYAINICDKQTLFHDYILQKKDIYISRIIGTLSNSNIEDYLKEKFIKSIGILASSNSKYNDKNGSDKRFF